jgi:hypothetical protein
MRRAAILLVAAAAGLMAQSGEFTHEAGAGLSLCPGCSPVAGGTAFYSTVISKSAGTRSISILDALPTGWRPMTVVTGTETGIEQHVANVKLPLLCRSVACEVTTIAAAGPAWTGEHAGWNWQVAGGLKIPVGAANAVKVMPRLHKSSINGGERSGYNLVVTSFYSWGW